MADKGEASTTLMDFGFNHLEAQVYHALLTASPATGYRLSQLFGRVPANTYQAPKALLANGAVVAEGARRRPIGRCRPSS